MCKIKQLIKNQPIMKKVKPNFTHPPLSDTDLKELESLNHRVDNISNDIREITVGLQKILAYLSDTTIKNSLGLPNHTDPN
jgi:hypothetical protein